MRATIPLHRMCSPPVGRLQWPCLPEHSFVNDLRISALLDMNPVGFLIGWPLASAPNWHWWATVLSTPSMSMIFLTSAVHHDIACAGCSWRK